MLAQRRLEVASPIACRPRRRKRSSLLRMLVRSRMACVLLLAIAVSFVLSVYVSAYARATENGYHKSDLLAHLRVVTVENESLRLKLDDLRKSDCIEKFAVENGMAQGSRIAYLKPAYQPRMAQNIEREDVK